MRGVNLVWLENLWFREITFVLFVFLHDWQIIFFIRRRLSVWINVVKDDVELDTIQVHQSCEELSIIRDLHV